MERSGLLIGLVLVLLLLVFGGLIFTLSETGMFKKKVVYEDVLPTQNYGGVKYIETGNYNSWVHEGIYLGNDQFRVAQNIENNLHSCTQKYVCASTLPHTNPKSVCMIVGCE